MKNSFIKSPKIENEGYYYGTGSKEKMKYWMLRRSTTKIDIKLKIDGREIETKEK